MKVDEFIKINKYKKKELNTLLRKNYVIATKDEEFNKLVKSLNTDEDIIIKYTSLLQESVKELQNCKNCRGIDYCKNKIIGYVYYPIKEGNGLIFSYRECKKNIKSNKNNVTYFETPKLLREAKMKDIFLDDKNRIKLIKYVKKFIDKYKSGEKIKGLYLYGSFGSGKSYILNAMLNELSNKNIKCVSVHYPSLLKMLKCGFGTDFEEKINEITSADILLLDDIGAENNTPWARDEVLSTILQYRMDNDLSTFFTSNFNLEELEEHLKDTNTKVDIIKARRIIERIKQLTDEMELIGENRR